MPATPRVTTAQAEEIARGCYGIGGSAERLAAEHDDAFRIITGDGSSRLLKISVVSGSAERGPAPVSLQAAILLHLASAAPRLPVQRVIPSLAGRHEVTWAEDGYRRIAALTSWLDGDFLGESAAAPGLRREVGATLARLSRALRGFSHPGARRTHRWDLQNLGGLRPLLRDLPDSGLLPEVRAALGDGGPGIGQAPGDGLRAALDDFLDRFDTVLRPRLAGVPTQVIHTDFHGLNLLSGGGRITGILDFGDALAGPVAMDVGVAACYQLGSGADVLAPALDVVAGYHAVDPLSPADVELAAEFIVARIVARIVVSQWNAMREPANAGYLLRRTAQAVEHFAALRLLSPDEIAGRLWSACCSGPFRATMR